MVAIAHAKRIHGKCRDVAKNNAIETKWISNKFL